VIHVTEDSKGEKGCGDIVGKGAAGRPCPPCFAGQERSCRSRRAQEGYLELPLVILAWTAFGVFHSLTVSERYERWAFRMLGERSFAAYHRILFTVYSAAAFLLLALVLQAVPDRPLYRLEGVIRLLFHAAQIGGAVLLFFTPWDLSEFVGITQWRRSRKGEPPEPGRNDRLFTRKSYGIVRHPLYLGISVILAFHPVQTRNSLVSAAMVILYFYVGTFFEERRMVRKFGEEYRDYQRRVPRFLPFRLTRKGGP
jgi:protein-S-isoprenylcysteine O-methyltransferase Ste14